MPHPHFWNHRVRTYIRRLSGRGHRSQTLGLGVGSLFQKKSIAPFCPPVVTIKSVPLNPGVFGETWVHWWQRNFAITELTNLLCNVMYVSNTMNPVLPIVITVLSSSNASGIWRYKEENCCRLTKCFLSLSCLSENLIFSLHCPVLRPWATGFLSLTLATKTLGKILHQYFFLFLAFEHVINADDGFLWTTKPKSNPH